MVFSLNPKIELKNSRLRFSFFKNNDFVHFLSFKNDKTVNFLDQISFQKEDLSLNLEDILQIHSEFSGIPVSIESMVCLTPSFSSLISEEAKKNGFNIKNNKLTAFFYTLSKIQDYPSVEFFYLWQFETVPIKTSRDQWSIKHFVELRNCCTLNFLLEKANSPSKLNSPSPFSHLELEAEKSCIFPNSVIDVKTEFSQNLLNASNLETQKQCEKLNLLVYKPFVFTTEFNQFPTSTNFLYTGVYRTQQSQNSVVLQGLSEDLIYTMNCKDLFTEISLENNSFEIFLFNCLFTIFQKQSFIFKETNVESKVDINLFCVDFVF